MSITDKGSCSEQPTGRFKIMVSNCCEVLSQTTAQECPCILQMYYLYFS